MKHFIYFESTDGGMETNKYEFKEDEEINFGTLGWMSEKYGTIETDTQLINWAKTCKIGDYFEHRMGTCVRVSKF